MREDRNISGEESSVSQTAAAGKTDEMERSLQKDRRYHERLVSPFARAVSRYELLRPNDRVAVCISGGKDSMLMAKLFQVLRRHQKFDFEVKFLTMDPGYSPANRARIEENAEKLGIPLTLFETRIFDAVDNIPKNPCYLCARMRRGYLYRAAQDLGCNKIALGHHYDDVIETILMSMLWAGQFQTMMPKLHSTNFEGMELIRPMYLIREEDIIDWASENNLRFLRCACHFTENCSDIRDDGTSTSKRLETKQLIRTLRRTNPDVEANLFKTAQNVNLDRVIAYKKDLVRHSFLEEYDSV